MNTRFLLPFIAPAFQRVAARPRLIAAAIACAAVAPAHAAYSITRYDAPGATGYTDIWAVNDAGQYVGTFAVGERRYGYEVDHGSLLRLDGPSGATFSYALGISAAGVVVGRWGTDPDGALGHGYLYEGGSYTSVDVPFAGASDTTLRAISPDGRYVAGTYLTSTSMNAFVLDRSSNVFTTVGQGVFSIAQGINSLGQMVGSVQFATDRQAFVYDIGSAAITYFSHPGAAITSARAINDLGQMSGWLQTDGAPLAWVGDASSQQTFAVGAANQVETFAEGLNNLGEIVGLWTDDAGDTHGFIATAAIPEPASAALLLAGLIALGAIGRRRTGVSPSN